MNASDGIDRDRAESFDAIAERYHRARPSYPRELIEDLLAASPSEGRSTILEVGCGTGIATLLFADRGHYVRCVEPGERMAAVARTACAGLDVEVDIARFEQWEPGDHRFDLVCAAQSFHWIDPAVGFAKAADLLVPNGVLGLFWNRHDEQSDSYGIFDDVYRAEVPELVDGYGHDRGQEQWTRRIVGRIAASGRFRTPEVRAYAWERDYTAAEFTDMLGTHSDHIALEPNTRRRLLDAVAARIAEMGGSFRKHYTTVLFTARRR